MSVGEYRFLKEINASFSKEEKEAVKRYKEALAVNPFIFQEGLLMEKTINLMIMAFVIGYRFRKADENKITKNMG